MSHHVEQQAGEHIVANDGISMRNTPRTESPTSNIDVGQLLGKNQTVNGLLSGAGDTGFHQVLASQVKREPAPSQPVVTRKETVANDKTSRSSGNSSPHNNTTPKNTATAKNVDRGNDRPDPDSRRAEHPANKRADDAQKTPEKASRLSASNESAATSKTRSTKGSSSASSEPAENKEKTAKTEKTDDAASPTAVDGSVANVSAAVETPPAVETSDATVPKTAMAGEESAMLLAAVANPQAETLGTATVATVTPTVPAELTVDGETGVAIANEGVAAVLAQNAKGDDVDASMLAGKDLGLLQRAISAANAVSVAPTNRAAGPVGEGVAANSALLNSTLPDASLPDPALKDLITAMIKTNENAGFSAEKMGETSVTDGSATMTPTMSATSQTKSAEQAMAALTRELRAPDALATKVNAEAIGTMKQSESPVEVVITSELMPTADEVEPLATASVEVSEENGEWVLDAEASLDSETEGLSLDAESDSDLHSPSAPATTNTSVSSARTVTSTVVDTLTATTKASEGPETSDGWSILDAATDIMPEDSPAGAELKLQSQVQTEQQMALVRNELRNLERFVDGGLQAAVRSVRETRKEDKANDIKPAALSRAIDSLGAGVKTAELRAGTSVTNTPVAFGRQGFAEQMAEKITLMTTQKVQVADIRLDPKEMGTIEVKIRVHQDQTTVVFSSANPQVRDALESSIPRLREMFADAGVGLGSVNVNDRGTSAGGNNEQSQGRGEAGGFGAEGDIVDERKPAPPRQSNGLVDYYA